MFTRVNNKLKTVNTKIKKKVEEYNQYSDVDGKTVTFSDFKEVAKISGVAPQFSKYHLRKRAIEEKQFVLDDAQRTVEFYQELIEEARKEVTNNLNPSNPESAAFFRMHAYQLSCRLQECQKSFALLSYKEISEAERIEIANAAHEGDILIHIYLSILDVA